MPAILEKWLKWYVFLCHASVDHVEVFEPRFGTVLPFVKWIRVDGDVVRHVVGYFQASRYDLIRGSLETVEAEVREILVLQALYQFTVEKGAGSPRDESANKRYQIWSQKPESHRHTQHYQILPNTSFCLRAARLAAWCLDTAPGQKRLGIWNVCPTTMFRIPPG